MPVSHRNQQFQMQTRRFCLHSTQSVVYRKSFFTVSKAKQISFGEIKVQMHPQNPLQFALISAPVHI